MINILALKILTSHLLVTDGGVRLETPARGYGFYGGRRRKGKASSEWDPLTKT